MADNEEVGAQTELSWGSAYKMELMLNAVAELHRKVTRYTTPVTEEYDSYDSLEEAREAHFEALDPIEREGDYEQPEFTYDTWEQCAECAGIERITMRENGVDDWAVVSIWPCRTAKALGLS